MTICRLFDHFDSKSRVHIDVNEIRDKIYEYKPNGVVRYEFVSTDPSVCPAKIIMVDTTGDTGIDGSYEAVIFISKNLSPKWRRLAATKELLHVLDEDHMRASSEIEVDHILEQFSGDQVGFQLPVHLNDVNGVTLAMGILLPRKCRELIKRYLEMEAYDLQQASNLTQMPIRALEIVLRDNFEDRLSWTIEINKPQ